MRNLCMRMAVCAGALIGLSGVASGQVSSVLVAQEGDAASGSTISTLNTPFTNGLGQVGFVAGLADTTRIVWLGAGPIFNSADALPDVLTGGEGTMGVSDAGGFIYSPSFNGADAVFGDGGIIAADGDQAHDFPMGVTSTFHSRPTMVNNGTAFWVAGYNDVGGTATIGRVFYRRAPDGTITRVLTSGDVVDGQTINTGSALGFAYWNSDDAQNYIIHTIFDTGSTTNDNAVVVNGTNVAQEAMPSGDGDNWDNFDGMSINNAGTYVFTGDTDGATTSDEFIAVNGAIVLREGTVVDGLTLGTSINGIALNDLDQVAFIWTTNATETLFVGDASDLAGATRIAAVGDMLDFNNDMVADAVLNDFNASFTIAPGMDFGEDGFIYVEVDMTPIGGVEIEAIIGFPVGGGPAPDGACCLFVAGCPRDCFSATEEDCTRMGGTFQGAGTTCGDCASFNPCDWNGDGNIDTADFFEFFAGFFADPPAADYDGNGATDTADFFGFFGCFFASPPGSQTFCE